MADDRWNEDQEQISDEVVGRAADENEDFEDVDEFDEDDQAEEDIDGL